MRNYEWKSEFLIPDSHFLISQRTSSQPPQGAPVIPISDALTAPRWRHGTRDRAANAEIRQPAVQRVVAAVGQAQRSILIGRHGDQSGRNRGVKPSANRLH